MIDAKGRETNIRELYNDEIEEGLEIVLKGLMRGISPQGLCFLRDLSSTNVVSLSIAPDTEIQGDPVPPILSEEEMGEIRRDRHVQVEGIYRGGANIDVHRILYLQIAPFEEEEAFRIILDITAYNDDSIWKRAVWLNINGTNINAVPWLVEKRVHQERFVIDPSLINRDGENIIEAFVSTYDHLGYNSWLTIKLIYEIQDERREELLWSRARATSDHRIKKSFILKIS